MFERSQVLAQLEQAKAGNNPAFAIAFALDNNPQAVLDNLAAQGYIINTPDELQAKQSAFQIIFGMAQQGEADLCAQMLNVPYNNDAQNGTGGFRDWFLRNTQTTAQERSMASQNLRTAEGGSANFSWGGLLSALGAGLGVYANTAMMQNQASGANLSPEQKKALEEEARKKAEEEERKKKVRTYWIIGGAVVGVLIIVGIIVAVSKSKNKAE